MASYQTKSAQPKRYLKGIFPTSLGALSYDVQASDVNYLQSTVDFSYMYYEIVQL